jgi:DNA-binding beta-propeller fold protein YncE
MHRYFVIFISFLACKTPNTVAVEERFDVAYIVSGEGRKIDVVDLRSQTIQKEYTIGVSSDRFPHHVYLSADKRKLAIAIPAYDFSRGHLGLHDAEVKGGIKILDADSGKELLSIDVPFANHNAIFSKDGEEVWTTVFSHSGRAYVYDASKGRMKSEIMLDPDPGEIIVSTDGALVAVASGESTFLQVIDAKSKEIVKKVKVDLGPTNVWPGYDNKVLVSNTTRKSVNFVNLTSLMVEDYIDFDFTPGFLIYNVLQKELWVCNGSEGKLHIFQKSDHWKEKFVMDDFTGEGPHMLQFFDSGKQALVITQKSSKAYFIDTENKEITGVLAVGSKPNGIAIKE